MDINGNATPQETANLKPAWGLTPPPGVKAAWGARTIYTENTKAYEANHTKAGTKRKRGRVPNFFVELVWDRQGGAGRNEDLQALLAWVDDVGLPAVKKLCDEQFITPESDAVVSFCDENFEINASPRSSYGYLYIGAWAK